MRRQTVLALILLPLLVSVNGENTTSNTQTSSTDTNLGEESALEKGAKPLYDLVHGFLDSVQEYDFITDDSGAKITYKEIEGYIKNGTFEKFSERWQDMVSVFGGFAACIIVGLLFAIFMPIIGLFFCCCYCCCRRCGKAKEKSDPKSAGCKRATYCFFLAIFATMMLTGGIVSIISNELLHNKLQNSDNRGPVQYLHHGLAEVISYGDESTKDLEEETKKIVGTTIFGIKKQINGSVQSTVDGVASSINASAVLTQTESLGKSTEKVYDDLVNITRNLEELKDLQSNLSTRIAQINDNFTSECQTIATTPPSGCPQLPDLSNNFTGVDDLESEINNVKQALNISDLTAKARSEFNTVVDKIYSSLQAEINNALKKSDDIEKDINNRIHKLTDTVKQFTESIRGNTSKEIDKVDEFLKKYADYVWYGGLGLPCVVFLSVAFYYLGILFGLCGQRPGHGAPCCNRGTGSNFIVGGVVWTFLIFWLLMYILMIMFIIGGLLYTNVCRNLSKGVENIGDFEALLQDNNIDIKKELNHSSNSNFTIKNALLDCKNNKGIYLALELQNSFDLDTLLDTTAVIKEIENLTNRSNFNIQNITIFSEDLKKALDKFNLSGISQINFTSYEKELNKTPIANLNELIDQARTYRLETQATIIEAFRDGEVKDFKDKMAELRQNLNNLKDQTELQNEVGKLQSQLQKAQDKFNSEKDDLIKQELNYTVANVTNIIKSAIEEAKNVTKNVGQCKRLYGAAQTLTDSVCVVVLDPFNTFWFGLGWGIFFSIPSIVFALLLANMYQREEPFDKDLHEAKKKSRQKQEREDFDSPMMENYMHPDSMPLTSPPNGGYARSDNGEVNRAYNNDRRDDYHSGSQYRDDYRRDDYHRGSQYRDDYRRDDYQGGQRDPYYRQGERDYPPPSYQDSRNYPSTGHHEAYPVLPTKNRY